MLTALAAEQPALLEWHLGRHKRALALCIAQIGRDPDDGFNDVEVRLLFSVQAIPSSARQEASMLFVWCKSAIKSCHSPL